MIIIDHEITADVQMMVWNGTGYDPDWSNDYFDAGLLAYDDELEGYIVKDVAYCIAQALEWAGENEDNTVMVNGTIIKTMDEFGKIVNE